MLRPLQTSWWRGVCSVWNRTSGRRVWFFHPPLHPSFVPFECSSPCATHREEAAYKRVYTARTFYCYSTVWVLTSVIHSSDKEVCVQFIITLGTFLSLCCLTLSDSVWCRKKPHFYRGVNDRRGILKERKWFWFTWEQILRGYRGFEEERWWELTQDAQGKNGRKQWVRRRTGRRGRVRDSSSLSSFVIISSVIEGGVA